MSSKKGNGNASCGPRGRGRGRGTMRNQQAAPGDSAAPPPAAAAPPHPAPDSNGPFAQRPSVTNGAGARRLPPTKGHSVDAISAGVARMGLNGAPRGATGGPRLPRSDPTLMDGYETVQSDVS